MVKNSKIWYLTSVWPDPWPPFSKNLYVLEISPPGLSNTLCRLSLPCVVLEISGGPKCPPPTGRVGRQSPTGRGLIRGSKIALQTRSSDVRETIEFRKLNSKGYVSSLKLFNGELLTFEQSINFKWIMNQTLTKLFLNCFGSDFLLSLLCSWMRVYANAMNVHSWNLVKMGTDQLRNKRGNNICVKDEGFPEGFRQSD